VGKGGGEDVKGGREGEMKGQERVGAGRRVETYERYGRQGGEGVKKRKRGGKMKGAERGERAEGKRGGRRRMGCRKNWWVSKVEGWGEVRGGERDWGRREEEIAGSKGGRR